MIETVAQLVALMASVQMWMSDPALAWPSGRSWALGVKYTLTDAILTTNAPSCCVYVTQPGSSVILRTDAGLVYLVKR